MIFYLSNWVCPSKLGSFSAQNFLVLASLVFQSIVDMLDCFLHTLLQPEIWKTFKRFTNLKHNISITSHTFYNMWIYSFIVYMKYKVNLKLTNLKLSLIPSSSEQINNIFIKLNHNKYMIIGLVYNSCYMTLTLTKLFFFRQCSALTCWKYYKELTILFC